MGRSTDGNYNTTTSFNRCRSRINGIVIGSCYRYVEIGSSIVLQCNSLGADSRYITIAPTQRTAISNTFNLKFRTWSLV